jgi:hypothetical protein
MAIALGYANENGRSVGERINSQTRSRRRCPNLGLKVSVGERVNKTSQRRTSSLPAKLKDLFDGAYVVVAAEDKLK